jgi:F0F1-type ATP synthase assembly protein I
MIDSIALRMWKQDVLRSLVFQWVLLLFVCGACIVFGWLMAVNALCVGLAIVIPSTALGAWMGIRILFGKVGSISVLIGGLLKTLLSAILIGAAFAVLQDIGWVWQGFFVGLVSMVFAPVLFGIVFGQSV